MTAINEYPGELEFEDEFEQEGEEYYEFEDHEGHLADTLDSVLGSTGARPLSEQQEYQLANQLLEVSSEEELEHFTSRLMRGATHRPARGAQHAPAHQGHPGGHTGGHTDGHGAVRGARRPVRP